MTVIRNIGQLTIRVGRQSLSFTETGGERGHEVNFAPYVVKSGISMAANLREALTENGFGDGAYSSVRVLTDTQALMVPIEQFSEDDRETLFHHSFPDSNALLTEHNVVPDLNAVALFGVNKDLHNVIADNFRHVTHIHAMLPVWRHLHQRSYTGRNNKLYGYFRFGQLDIFSFRHNRFRFCNSFSITNAHDALYFLLYVWNQLHLDTKHDELHLVGEMPKGEPSESEQTAADNWLTEQLRSYLAKVYIINPAAEFNRAPASLIGAMPFDLMTLIVKDR